MSGGGLRWPGGSGGPPGWSPGGSGGSPGGSGGRRGWRLTRRGRVVLGGLRPILGRADLAVCHLEVPLSRDGRAVASWPSFNAPPQLAAALRWAGYDACSTASNHAMGRGPAGVAATLDVMDGAGLRHALEASRDRTAAAVGPAVPPLPPA
jgi:hypothetical protein